MAVMKKCLVRCLCLLLALSLSAAGALAESPASPGMAYLAGEMESAAGLLMAYGQDVDIYASREWHRDLVVYPEKLDLRELGLVTPVKSQKPWDSCWSFGTIAGCESSILSNPGYDRCGF